MRKKFFFVFLFFSFILCFFFFFFQAEDGIRDIGVTGVQTCALPISCHFWGLYIGTVSTICLVLAVGLTVDYASHVAHTFMVTPGTTEGNEFD